MRRKGVVFSKMFVLRSMGNELVPSPLYENDFSETLFEIHEKIRLLLDIRHTSSDKTSVTCNFQVSLNEILPQLHLPFCEMVFKSHLRVI